MFIEMIENFIQKKKEKEEKKVLFSIGDVLRIKIFRLQVSFYYFGWCWDYMYFVISLFFNLVSIFILVFDV